MGLWEGEGFIFGSKLVENGIFVYLRPRESQRSTEKELSRDTQKGLKGKARRGPPGRRWAFGDC
jgi:hypothetical protein